MSSDEMRRVLEERDAAIALLTKHEFAGRNMSVMGAAICPECECMKPKHHYGCAWKRLIDTDKAVAA